MPNIPTPLSAVRMLRRALALCVFLACLVGLAVPSYGAEPTFDGDVTGLSAENWMRGISGDRLLSDIVLPGAAGAATASPYLAGQRVSGSSETDCVKSQELSLADQLASGVRLLELHLTRQQPDGSGEGDALWVAEQIETTRGKALCYCQDASGNVITFKRAITDARMFLQSHPSETVVVALSETDDAASVFRQLREELDDNSECLYLGSAMPALRDVRGRVVVCTTHPELLGENGGLPFPTRGAMRM